MKVEKENTSDFINKSKEKERDLSHLNHYWMNWEI